MMNGVVLLPGEAGVVPLKVSAAGAKVAVMACEGLFTVRVQGLRAPQAASLQLTNTAPESGAALSVTDVPKSYVAAQVTSPATVQVMKVSRLWTVPLPETVTVSVSVSSVNAAPTEVAAVVLTWQVAPLPLHAPDHPVKCDPVEASAVGATDVT